jgi:alpha,alpha-trehalose phosphorylase
MWSIKNNSIDKNQLLINESLFTLANGYLGVRGCFEEGYCDGFNSIRGTYINGVYDIIDVTYSESAYGFPETQEKQPNLIDGQSIDIYLDGEKVSLFHGKHNKFEREIHLDRGFSERSFLYSTTNSKVAKISIKRMVSFDIKELFIIDVKVEYDGYIKIISTINSDVENYVNKEDPRVAQGHSKLTELKYSEIDDELLKVTCETKRSQIEISCVCTHKILRGNTNKSFEKQNKHLLEAIFHGTDNLNITKYIAYTDSRKHINSLEEGRQIILEAIKLNFDVHLKNQEEYLKKFWEVSDIIINGDDKIQEALRFNNFQLFQSVGKDGISNISAKGLSGEGYEGHYFWDTEVYIFPFLVLTQPEIARELLKYRHSLLESARKEAIILGHKRGIKFPWRTIAGRECSTYFPAGTAQYHINGDIAYSFIIYYLQTNDLDFVINYAAEVIFETARLWLDIGHFHRGKFCIDAVTGPDEYTAIVNNNYFTNSLAKFNLKWAIKFYEIIKSKYPEKLNKIAEKIGMNEEEIEEMRIAEEKMYLPHSEVLGIDMQDDHFLSKKVWDFENTPKEKYPLLLHFHPLTIYRHQVLKQADTVLAHLLLEDYTNFDTIKNSYDYYEKITTHDSSLSSCIYGIMASKVGYFQKAVDYFNESIRLDLDNTHGNTSDGLHMANLSGSCLTIIKGFAGYRINENEIILNPWIPRGWEDYSFHIKYKNSIINLKVADKVKIKLISGDRIKIKVYENEYFLEDELVIETQNS